jgi:hypothetical protein
VERSERITCEVILKAYLCCSCGERSALARALAELVAGKSKPYICLVCCCWTVWTYFELSVSFDTHKTCALQSPVYKVSLSWNSYLPTSISVLTTSWCSLMQLAKAVKPCVHRRTHMLQTTISYHWKCKGERKKKKEDSSTHSLAHLAQVASIKADGDGRTDGQPASKGLVTRRPFNKQLHGNLF